MGYDASAQLNIMLIAVNTFLGLSVLCSQRGLSSALRRIARTVVPYFFSVSPVVMLAYIVYMINTKF